MSNSMNMLARHVAGTLPDSLHQRLTLLKALRNVMKASHPAHGPVLDQIAALQQVQRLQAELPGKLGVDLANPEI